MVTYVFLMQQCREVYSSNKPAPFPGIYHSGGGGGGCFWSLWHFFFSFFRRSHSSGSCFFLFFAQQSQELYICLWKPRQRARSVSAGAALDLKTLLCSRLESGQDSVESACGCFFVIQLDLNTPKFSCLYVEAAWFLLLNTMQCIYNKLWRSSRSGWSLSCCSVSKCKTSQCGKCTPGNSSITARSSPRRNLPPLCQLRREDWSFFFFLNTLTAWNNNLGFFFPPLSLFLFFFSFQVLSQAEMKV